MSVPQQLEGFLADSLNGQPLIYSNSHGSVFHYHPTSLTITASLAPLRARYPILGGARLHLPEHWSVQGANEQPITAETATLTWTIVPGGIPAACQEQISCEILAGDTGIAAWDHLLPVTLQGETTFNPVRDIAPFRNSAADIGAVEPQRDLFARTYKPWGMILPGAFFQGLYRDIVFLAAGPDARGGGGLCTGMARYALGTSLTGIRPFASQVRDVVEIWHGRQLTDAALLAAAQQFLKPDAARSFRHFRNQVLTSGEGTVAFDVGIARWSWNPREWPALFQRLVTQGHTIVPYAFAQINDTTAQVQVYDPSHPSPEEAAENIVHFDLAQNRYQYRGFGALDRDDPTTVLAVTQRPFAEPGTAFIASTVSLFTNPQAGLTELVRVVAVRRSAVAAIAGAVGLLIVRSLRRRLAA